MSRTITDIELLLRTFNVDLNVSRIQDGLKHQFGPVSWIVLGSFTDDDFLEVALRLAASFPETYYPKTIKGK